MIHAVGPNKHEVSCQLDLAKYISLKGFIADLHGRGRPATTKVSHYLDPLII